MKLGKLLMTNIHSTVIGPQLSRAEVLSTLQTSYQLQGKSAHRLGGETASNAKIVLADDTQVMYKAVAVRDKRNVPPVLAELQWRASLVEAALASDLPVARPIPTPHGELVAVQEYDDLTLLIQLSSWLPGIPLAQMELSEEHTRLIHTSIGEIAGKLQRVYRGFARPPKPNNHPWAFETMDSIILNALKEGAEDLIEPERVKFAKRVVELYQNTVRPQLETLTRGITHQDLNDFNILIDTSSRGPYVSGVIDFDDAREAPLIAEVSIAAAYCMLGQDDPLKAIKAVAIGASRHNHLTEAEMQVLLTGAVTRLVLNAVLWTQRSAQSGNAYGCARMAKTWPTLEKLAHADWNLERNELLRTAGS